MKVICLIFLLVAASLAEDCYDGDLYLFAEDTTVYQASSSNGTISPRSFTTDCLLGSVTNAGENILVSCFDKPNFTPTIMTISQNTIVSSIGYQSPCSIYPIAYDQSHSLIYGTYMQNFLINTTFGWSEGTIVTFDATTGDVVSNTSFFWNHLIYITPAPISSNGSCVTMINGQYSFVDEKGQMLYTISSPQVAQFNISNGAPEFVKKQNLDNLLCEVWAYDSEDRMVYAVSGSDLYRFSIDNEWEYDIVSSGIPSVTASSMGTMDSSNSNYLVLQSLGSDWQLTIYNLDTENVTTITLQSSISNLDIRQMIAYNYESCYTPPYVNSSTGQHKKPKDIAKIVAPVVIGGVLLVAIAGFLLYRRRRHGRHHYEMIHN